MKRILLAMLAATPLPAAGQQPASSPPVVLRPDLTTALQPSELELNPTQLQLHAMRQEINKLKADLAATKKALADATAQLTFASGLITSLNTRFLAHRHRVNGDVGNGFSSGYDGSGIYVSYMTPIKDASARFQARETGAPLP